LVEENPDRLGSQGRGSEKGQDSDSQDENAPRIGNKMDSILDSILNRFMGKARKTQEKYQHTLPKLKDRVDKVTKESADRLKNLDQKGDKFVGKIRISKFTDALITPIVKRPFIPLLLVITLVIIAIPGLFNVRDNIRGDMEVYLPLEARETEIIEEVRQNWTIDILMIYIETGNVNDRTNETNITSLDVLNDISLIERTLDPQKYDRGENDSVIFTLSIASLIKEINSTAPRFAQAVIDEFGIGELGQYPLPPGEYSIPQDQTRIDTIMDQIPLSAIAPLLADTNDDGIYDSTIAVIGITAETDQDDFMRRAEGAFSNVKFCSMTSTGPIPMTQDLTDRIYEEMIKVVPIAVIMIGISLFLFHRNWKILVIEGIPLISELIITFGIVGYLGMVLTPQIVLVAPIIASLGVANGLYITNKYSETDHIKDRSLRMRLSIQSTAKPIIFAALTTSLGFLSLTTINMIPMKMLGVALAIGILTDFVVTFLTVPALVLLLRYKKKTKVGKKSKFSKLPVNHTKKVLFAVIILVVMSLVSIVYPGIEANMDYMAMSPQDEPSIIKLDQYTRNFEGGQINMFLVRGRPAKENSIRQSMKDLELLDDLDYLSSKINGDPDNPNDHGVDNSMALGITDIMRTIRVPNMTDIPPLEELFDIFPALEDIYLNSAVEDFTFWDLIHSDNLNQERKEQMVNIFYNSLTYEMRGMLINDDYSRTLVYVTMPNMDTVHTEKAVDGVNDNLDKFSVGDSTSLLTGFGPIVVKVNSLLVESSLISTAMAILLVGILLVIGFKSIKFAVLTIIPIIFVVGFQPLAFLLTKGIGGIVGQSFSGQLNLFSAMIGSVIIGLGIDFAIHMTDTIREKGGRLKNVTESVATTGRSFVETTITMCMGLFAILFINIVSVREFIVLIILLLVYSMVGGLLILPTLYTYYLKSKKKKEEY